MTVVLLSQCNMDTVVWHGIGQSSLYIICYSWIIIYSIWQNLVHDTLLRHWTRHTGSFSPEKKKTTWFVIRIKKQSISRRKSGTQFHRMTQTSELWHTGNNENNSDSRSYPWACLYAEGEKDGNVFGHNDGGSKLPQPNCIVAVRLQGDIPLTFSQCHLREREGGGGGGEGGREGGGGGEREREVGERGGRGEGEREGERERGERGGEERERGGRGERERERERERVCVSILLPYAYLLTLSLIL